MPVVMIDEFYIASHLDDRSQRNITRRNVCALDFFSKKFGSSRARGFRQFVYQRT
jgi:hypothetical protein